MGEEVANDTTAQRIERQDGESERIERSRPNDKLHEQRVAARNTLERWSQSAEEVNQGAADWSRNNWIEFLSLTGGEYESFPSPGPVMGVLKKALGDWIDLTFEFETVAAKLFAKHIEDSLVDVFFEKMGSEAAPSREATADKAVRSVGTETAEKSEEINGLRDRGLIGIRDTKSSLLLKIQQAASEEQLREITKAASSNRKPSLDMTSRTLRDGLLREWLMQRAATPKSANRFTNPDSWKNVKNRFPGQNPLERQDLFIHQCAYEWSRLGLSGIDFFTAWLEGRRMELDEQFRGWGNDAAASARYVASFLSASSQQSLRFTGSDNPSKTSQEFAKEFSSTNVAMGGEEQFARGMNMYCTMALGTDGTAIYVKFWRYRMTVDGQDQWVVRFPDRRPSS